MTASKRDEAAAVGVDPAELVGTLPGRVERRDPAATSAGHAAIVAARRELEVKLLGHERQKFLDQEPDIVVAHAVVFEAAVPSADRVLDRGRQFPRPDEHANRHRHLPGGDQGFEQAFSRSGCSRRS